MEATPGEYKYLATLKGEQNWYAEARAMFGKSFDVGSNCAFSLYWFRVYVST